MCPSPFCTAIQITGETQEVMDFIRSADNTYATHLRWRVYMTRAERAIRTRTATHGELAASLHVHTSFPPSC